MRDAEWNSPDGLSRDHRAFVAWQSERHMEELYQWVADRTGEEVFLLKEMDGDAFFELLEEAWLEGDPLSEEA